MFHVRVVGRSQKTSRVIVAPCSRWQVQATKPEIIDECSSHEDGYVGIWKQLVIEATAMAAFHNVEVMNEDCDSHVQFLISIGRNRSWMSPLSDRQSVKYRRLQDKNEPLRVGEPGALCGNRRSQINTMQLAPWA